MKQLNLPAICLLALCGCAQKEPVPPGIPLDLAELRRAALQNVTYDLYFDIPQSRGDSIPARTTVKFEWTKEPIDLLFDYRASASTIQRITVNGEEIKLRCENEHILIGRETLDSKANEVTFEFTAGESALNRNDEYLYTLFVPSRASTCFPLFDQPDLKAVFNLELLVPPGWEAISNGKVTSMEVKGGKTLLRFAPTKPSSSYQFAFAVGKFSIATDPVSGMNMFYRETDSAKVARNLPRIFELHRNSLTWLADYTGIPYPYEKFDFALMPAFQFGGMEHPGSIFYRESSLFLDASASVNEELRRASLIAHETAHMWFGNLVTMKWFNDVWLKEVFANFMAAKIVSPLFPSINHELRFLMAHYPAAYEIDRSGGSHPIQQPLDNLQNAGSVYGAIIYQKAPIMMRNLETWIGAENFQRGIRDYLTRYAYGNATWDDLVIKLKPYAKQDLEIWNRAWIKTGGMPEIEVTKDSTGKSFLKIVNDSTSLIIWPQSVDYHIKSAYVDAVQKVTFRNSSRALLTKWVESGMKFLPNYRGGGYGYFHGDADYLLTEVKRHPEAEVRAGIWITLWEDFLHHPAQVAGFAQEVLQAVAQEKDPLLLEYLTDKLDRLYWQFLPSSDRSLMSKQVEISLLERLTTEKDNSCKRTLFNAYRSLAATPDGVANLGRMWSGKINFGLELSERDRIHLAYALALRQADGFEKILDEQLGRITNPDLKAEMSFVRQALSDKQEVRDTFFESLKEKEQRAREPWVLEALRYLHHPLRGNVSVRYIRPSLQMLVEIQRTGDIFFPKGWLDATLGYYRSPEAADEVRDYLDANGDLRQDLRNKLLQSADMLFRAEKVSPEPE